MKTYLLKIWIDVPESQCLPDGGGPLESGDMLTMEKDAVKAIRGWLPDAKVESEMDVETRLDFTLDEMLDVKRTGEMFNVVHDVPLNAFLASEDVDLNYIDIRMGW